MNLITLYKVRIFLLTFLSYALFTAMRQPFGIAKASLHPDKDDNGNYDSPGYAPFNDSNLGSFYLGASDTIFLSFYAIGLFVSGPLGDYKATVLNISR